MATKKQSGKLYSGLPYTVHVDNDGVKMEVPPFSVVKIADVTRCGKLPAGIKCVKDK